MSGQFEYDVGPQPTETDGEASDDRGRIDGVLDSPWVVGFVGGGGTFLAVYAIMYQLASALLAAGTMSASEEAPTRRVLAGLTMLVSHGGTLELPDETMGNSLFTVFTPHISAIITVLALLAAGYLLVRYLATDDLVATGKAAASAGGVFLTSYVVLSVLLAAFTRWTPSGDTGDATGTPGSGVTDATEPETISVAADLSLVLTVGGTVVAFLTLGGLLALYVTFGTGGRETARVEPVDQPTEHETDAVDHDGEDADARAEKPPRTGEGDEPLRTDRKPAPDSRSASRIGAPEPPRRSVDPERRDAGYTAGNAARDVNGGEPEWNADGRESARNADGENAERNAEEDQSRRNVDPRDRYGTDLPE